jgi:hypothetical protein
LTIIAAVLVLLVLVALIGAVAMSVFFFIGVDDGRLTVFSGLPVSVGPLDLNVPYRHSSGVYDALSPAAKEIVDARRIGSRQEVLELASDLGMWP